MAAPVLSGAAVVSLFLGRCGLIGALGLRSKIKGDHHGKDGQKIPAGDSVRDGHKKKQPREGQCDQALNAQEVIDPPPDQGVQCAQLLSLHSMPAPKIGDKNFS